MSKLNDLGCQIVDGYFDSKNCISLLREIAEYRKSNSLLEIHRPMKARALRYKVIDGITIKDNFPSIWNSYSQSILQLVREQSGIDLEIMGNQKVGVNINIMAPQLSSYRWHYDRNKVTAILYLNTVEGGETVLFPNYRILLNGKKMTGIQRILDSAIQIPVIRSIFSERTIVEPQAGRLVIMNGKRCWHSVRPLQGEEERINIIFAYDTKDGAEGNNNNLDSYLYSQEKRGSTDPNYK